MMHGLLQPGEDGTVRLWNIKLGSPVGDLIRTFGGELTDLAFSPDGSLIAAGARDGLIRLWDASTQRLIGEPPHCAAGVRRGDRRGVAALRR